MADTLLQLSEVCYLSPLAVTLIGADFKAGFSLSWTVKNFCSVMSYEAVLSLTSTPRTERGAICLTSSRGHVMRRSERNTCIQALMDGIPSYDCHR